MVPSGPGDSLTWHGADRQTDSWLAKVLHKVRHHPSQKLQDKLILL